MVVGPCQIIISLFNVMGQSRVGRQVIKENKCPTKYIPYPCERGPIGGAPYIGPRLGDEPIFEVSVLHLVAKERPGKLPTLSS